MNRSEAADVAYSLGIDLGTTYSAAAVAREGSTVEVCTLGTTSQAIPSVVVLREDGEILTGEAAERRAPTEPTRTAREFKRRLGDPVPMIVGTTPYGAEALMGFLLRAIVAQVTEREGAAPDVVVLTHPANYSDYKRGLLEEAARLAGLDLGRVRFVTEPQAAAVAYAGQRRVEAGEVVAVYDFGGGTFDAAVVRKDEDEGFTLLGSPEGMDRLGGIDIDQAVLAHVDAAVDGMVTGADASDPAVRSAIVRLRDEARSAKEGLSTDTDATIAVALPGLQTEIRITREELEAMIRPRVAETVEALRRAVASTGTPMEQVSRILLVGGSSRIPLVGLLVREMTERPVAVDAHPKLAIATGAAIVGAKGMASPEDAAPIVAGAAPTTVVEDVAGATAGNGGVGRGTLAAAAGVGFAATAAGAAVLGAGGASAGAAEAAVGGVAAGVGPAGIASVAGPAGTPLVSGPAGTPTVAGPAGTAVPPPTAAGPPPSPAGGGAARTAAKVAKTSRRIPVIAATAVGVVAAVAVVGVVATSGGDDPPPAESTTVVAAAAAPTSAGETTVAPTTAPPGARGVTGAAAIIAGLRFDNSGKGAPGVATAISLGSPTTVVVGPDGSAYVLDTTGSKVLRIKGDQATIALDDDASIGGLAVSPTGKVVLLTHKGLVEITGDGQSTLIAPLAELGDGQGPGSQSPLAYDGAGNLYIGNSNRNRVVRRAVDGTMSLVAGSGEFAGVGPPKGDGGAATAAPLSAINALAIDAKGNLLIGEALGAVRRVAVDGTISTIAGAGAQPVAPNTSLFPPDGTKAAELDFAQVDAIVVDAKGRVYIADSQSGLVMRLRSDGGIELIVGDQAGVVEPETNPRPANQVRFADANGMAFEKSGALLIAEAGILLRVEDVAAS